MPTQPVFRLWSTACLLFLGIEIPPAGRDSVRRTGSLKRGKDGGEGWGRRTRQDQRAERRRRPVNGYVVLWGGWWSGMFGYVSHGRVGDRRTGTGCEPPLLWTGRALVR